MNFPDFSQSEISSLLDYDEVKYTEFCELIGVDSSNHDDNDISVYWKMYLKIKLM